LILLLALALICAILGLTTAAKFLLIVALVLLLLALIPGRHW